MRSRRCGTSVRLDVSHSRGRRRGGSVLDQDQRISKTPRLPKRSWGFCLKTTNAGTNMKTTRKRTRPKEERLARLPSDELPSPPFGQGTELERLKERLLEQLLPQTTHRPDLSSAYRRAANDAVSLAWVTPFPLLVLPSRETRTSLHPGEREGLPHHADNDRGPQAAGAPR